MAIVTVKQDAEGKETTLVLNDGEMAAIGAGGVLLALLPKGIISELLKQTGAGEISSEVIDVLRYHISTMSGKVMEARKNSQEVKH